MGKKVENTIKGRALRRERFCQAYVTNGYHGVNAAKAAGFCKESVEYGVAAATASRLLKHPEVKARIEELEADALRSTMITKEKILRELYDLATVDIHSCLDKEGELLPLNKWPANARKALASFEVSDIVSKGETIGTLRKAKFTNKEKFLEMLARHLSLFKDKIEHDVSKSLEDILTEANKKTRDEQ